MRAGAGGVEEVVHGIGPILHVEQTATGDVDAGELSGGRAGGAEVDDGVAGAGHCEAAKGLRRAAAQVERAAVEDEVDVGVVEIGAERDARAGADDDRARTCEVAAQGAGSREGERVGGARTKRDGARAGDGAGGERLVIEVEGRASVDGDGVAAVEAGGGTGD